MSAGDPHSGGQHKWLQKIKTMSNTLVVVGAQWGDEGKGKITDFYAGDADVVVRHQGGNNAGFCRARSLTTNSPYTPMAD